MVDPFVDPLNAAPVSRPNSALNRNPAPSVRASEGRSFQQILQQQQEQRPAPIFTPEALIPPLNTPVSRPVETQPTQVPPVHQAHIEENPSIQSGPPQAGHGSIVPNRSVEPVQETQPPSLAELMKRQRTETVHSEPHPSLELEIDVGSPIRRIEAVTDPKASLILEQTPVEDLPGDEEVSVLYTIQRGDTLSGIVANALRRQGVPYTTSDIYRMVRSVAQENGIQDPNVIYAGRTLNLSSVYSEITLAHRGDAHETAMLPGEFTTPANGRLTSHFGMRTHPIHHDERFHSGIDIAMPTGTPVRPFRAGVVSYSGERGGYGQMIEVDHGDGTFSRYAHLSERLVDIGQQVNTSKPLARSGSTGTSTGPHLHFEIRENGRPVNPLTILPAHLIESRPADERIQIARGDLPADR